MKAAERSALGVLPVKRIGLHSRALCVHRDDRIELRIQGVDGLEAIFQRLSRGKRSRRDSALRRGHSGSIEAGGSAGRRLGFRHSACCLKAPLPAGSGAVGAGGSVNGVATATINTCSQGRFHGDRQKQARELLLPGGLQRPVHSVACSFRMSSSRTTTSISAIRFQLAGQKPSILSFEHTLRGRTRLHGISPRRALVRSTLRAFHRLQGDPPEPDHR